MGRGGPTPPHRGGGSFNPYAMPMGGAGVVHGHGQWALPVPPGPMGVYGGGGGYGGGRGGNGKKNKVGGGVGQNQLSAKNVRRAADAGRVDEALHGMTRLVQMGCIESQTFGMVGAAAVKAGKVRALADMVNNARETLRGRPVLQLAILHSILTSVTINCVAEDEHVSELVRGLTDVTEFTEGDHIRAYFTRIATGLLNEYIDEARAALDRSRTVSVDALVRMGNCHADVTCQPGLKAGEIKCSIPMGAGGGEERRGISGGDLVGFSPYPPTGYGNEGVIEVDILKSKLHSDFT